MKKKDNAGKTLQDVGLGILLAALLLSALLFSATVESYLESAFMLVGIFLAVLFACFRLPAVAIVIAGLQTVAFAAYKIYGVAVLGQNVEPLLFGWIVLPALAMAGSLLFVNGLKKTMLENQILKQQVEELIMIDPLTGFYNLRSLFMDIQTQISYAERNNNAISLMIIKFRYVKELKSVLKEKELSEVIKRLSKIASDTVRLEDRVYSIDEDGSLGILLTCDKTGAKSVEKRLRTNVAKPEAFEGAAGAPIRVEIQIGCLQYKKEEFQRDARLWKESVEEEVEYDL